MDRSGTLRRRMMPASDSSSSSFFRPKTMPVKDNSCSKRSISATSRHLADPKTILRPTSKNHLSQDSTVICRFRPRLTPTRHYLNLTFTGIKQSANLPSRSLSYYSSKIILPSPSHPSNSKTLSQLSTPMRRGSNAWPTCSTASGIGTAPWIERSEGLIFLIDESLFMIKVNSH